MNNYFKCYANAAFGMESLVAGELRKLGIENVNTENGGVYFTADRNQIFICNLLLHFSDRVYCILASDSYTSFEQLFNMVYEVNWTSFFIGSESIDVTCKCTRSTLMSPRDCQSITKKAIIEKIKSSGRQTVFDESGPSLPVFVSVRNDQVMIMLNTSGEALSRRGYRTWNGEAPLRETLAAALIQLSGWHPGQPLHDPCCGSGTILTEAALIACRRAPGFRRSFAMETVKCFQTVDFAALREHAALQENFSLINDISGSDIDPKALELAHRHIVQAGIDPKLVSIKQIALQDLTLSSKNGVFICNPPYGERIGDQQQAESCIMTCFC